MVALWCRVPSWGHRLWSGAGWKRREVVWRAFSRVDDGRSRRHGVAGSRRWACDDGRAQDGGVVWRRGGVDGRETWHGRCNNTSLKMDWWQVATAASYPAGVLVEECAGLVVVGAPYPAASWLGPQVLDV